ncbi:MAG: SIMPL domain-containing protein [bacterium]|nr:SIMPL domain-containing protein [bacterium]
MSEKIKNILGVSVVIALFAFAYAVVGYANSFSRQIDSSAPRFSVSGEGKVVVIPDIAEFTFGVLTEGGKDVASLQKENAKKMNTIIKFIKSKGVDAKDIKTLNYGIQPRYQYYECGEIKTAATPCPPREIVGYSINQRARVKVRDFNKAGEILSGVGQRGANSVSQLSFSVDDRIKFENEAREKAIKQARERALSIARAAGFRLGRLISVNDNQRGFPYSRQQRALGFEEFKGQSEPSNIEPGSQEITSSITLQYQIK